jgi:hypothetical protein
MVTLQENPMECKVTIDGDYAPAAIVREPMAANLWVAPNGTAHYAPDHGHIMTALFMGTSSVALIRAGWVQVSLAHPAPGHPAGYACKNRDATQAQLNTLYAFHAWAIADMSTPRVHAMARATADAMRPVD